MQHFAASIMAVRWNGLNLETIHAVTTVHLTTAQVERAGFSDALVMAKSSAVKQAERRWKKKDKWMDHKAEVVNLGNLLQAIGFTIKAGS